MNEQQLKNKYVMIEREQVYIYMGILAFILFLMILGYVCYNVGYQNGKNKGYTSGYDAMDKEVLNMIENNDCYTPLKITYYNESYTFYKQCENIQFEIDPYIKFNPSITFLGAKTK